MSRVPPHSSHPSDISPGHSRRGSTDSILSVHSQFSLPTHPYPPPGSPTGPSPPRSNTERTSIPPSPRGIYNLFNADSSPNGDTLFPKAAAAILGYTFRDEDLLEEALESCGSGVIVVGKSKRVCESGNSELARVGENLVCCVLRADGYMYRMTNDEIKTATNMILSTKNLSAIGKTSQTGATLEQMVRPRAPLRPSKRKNMFHVLMKDVQAVGHDGDRLIARAVKAIIGAVYFDGGYDPVRRVMAQLGLSIQAP